MRIYCLTCGFVDLLSSAGVCSPLMEPCCRPGKLALDAANKSYIDSVKRLEAYLAFDALPWELRLAVWPLRQSFSQSASTHPWTVDADSPWVTVSAICGSRDKPAIEPSSLT